MEKVKKQKTHKLTEKHPVISALLFAAGWFILMQVITVVVNTPIHLAIQAYPADLGFVGALIGAVLMLWCYKASFKPEFQGCLRGGSIPLGLKLGSFHVGYILLSTFIAPLFMAVSYVFPSFSQVSGSILAGVTEECAFRGVLIATLMRQWKRDETKILPAAIISGVVFGLIHLTNISVGASISITIYQTIAAGLGGVFFAAVFLRSGNLLPCMILHTLQDITASCIADSVEDSMVMTRTFALTDIPDVVLVAALAGIGIWLIRPAKRGEITALWQEKWTDPAVNTES